jgi:hypothetical protein
MGRRVRKFDGAFGPEGYGGGFAASFIKKGRGFAAGCVEGLHRFAQGATALRAEGDGGALTGADYKKSRPAPSVISTEAERSGEISPSDGTGSITAGDLSTQSIIGAVSICLPYRQAPPLEMTVAAGTPIVMLKKGATPPWDTPSAVTSTSSIIIRITTVHPFATSWPSSPKGDARGVTGLAVCVICDTISSATYFLVSP